MSRKKKSRKPGSTGDVDLIVTRNRTESDIEGRLRKKEKKRKGLKTGNRNSEAQANTNGSMTTKRDPRLGSKKKIPLVVTSGKSSKPQRKQSAEQELAELENDAQLNVLLDRLDNGESLGAGLQQYVDQKLARIEVLMKQLGLYVEDEVEELPLDEPKVKKTKSRSDASLLDEFENLDWKSLDK